MCVEEVPVESDARPSITVSVMLRIHSEVICVEEVRINSDVRRRQYQ